MSIWAPGTFLAAYRTNQASANDLALESSPIGRLMLEHLEMNDGWSGSSSELLEILRSKVQLEVTRQPGWPKDARALSNQLKRISPNLRSAGWSIDYERQSRRRLWTIQRMTQTAEPSTTVASLPVDDSSAFNEDQTMQSDADSGNWPYGDAYDGDGAIPLTDGQHANQFNVGEDFPI